MAEVSTKYWHFRQNNSGGSFDIDDANGIGVDVWIEAVDEGRALSRAGAIGIYFDGVAAGRDCGCCGDRWSTPWEDPVSEVEIDERFNFNWHNTVYIHRISGEIDRQKSAKTANAGAA